MQNLPDPSCSGNIVVDHAEHMLADGRPYRYTHEVSPNGLIVIVNGEWHFIAKCELRRMLKLSDKLAAMRDRQAA